MNLRQARVGDIAEQIRGVTYGKTESSSAQAVGLKPILRAGNIGVHGVDFDDLVFIPAQRISAKQMLRKHDIIIATSSGSIAMVGKSALLLEDFDGGFGAFCKVLRPSTEVDPAYFAQFFRTPGYRSTISNLAAGANINNLKNEHLDDLRVPLPTLPEQRRLAAILDHADALRTHRRANLSALDELAQSCFVSMFGNPITNRLGLSMTRLGEVGNLDRGVSRHRPRNDPLLLGGQHPLIQTGDVANSGGYITNFTSTYSNLGLTQSKLWPSGTLCITIAANIAKAGILTFEACFPDSVVGFTASHQSTVEYVRVWLTFLQATIEAAAPESAQKNINLAILRELPISLPPQDDQDEFATRLSAINTLKETHRVSLAELEALFASLQHRAFRGDL